MRTFSPLFQLRLTLLAAIGSTAACGSAITTPDPTGSGGGNSTGNTGATNGSTGSGSDACIGAVPVLTANGADSGWLKCPDGTINRGQASACDTTVRADACAGTEQQFNCKTDADCTDSPTGKCITGAMLDFGGQTTTYCGCVYSCADDADCAAGQVCVCDSVVSGSTFSFCAPANCQSDADCASGECGISSANDGCGNVVEVACRKEEDACRVKADCAEGQECATRNGELEWKCWSPSCAIGRPLLIEGQAHTAKPRRRDDWTGRAPSPRVDAISSEVRAALAQHWSDVAALEHASIGSFARFTLELLALGAPPEMLAEAQQAALDEIEHARLAYAVASAYAGSAIGPAALPAAAAAPVRTTLVDILVGLVEEACVGETVGVAEALHLAGTVRDPELAAMHARIAEDETRHAALAWRVLKWGFERADANTRQRVARAFDESTRSMAAVAPARSAVERDHGLCSSLELAVVRRRAIEQVVMPCARELLGSDVDT